MRLLPTFMLVLACSGCAVTPTPATPPPDTPADRFLAAIAAHCGKAYVGRVVANQPAPTTPDAFDNKMLVMHVRGCDQPEQRIEIPFHVGEDRSRTWVLTRTAGGLRLKHDHRHADGSPDAVTMYGGESLVPEARPDRRSRSMPSRSPCSAAKAWALRWRTPGRWRSGLRCSPTN